MPPHSKFDRAKTKIDLSQLFDRQLPQAYETECALLGSLLLDSNMTGEVILILDGADDFYRPSHASIYRVIVELYDKTLPVDMVHLKQHLEDRNELEQIGGVDYLLMLAESVPSAMSAPYYAKIVREKAVLRKLIEAAGNILHQAYTTNEEVAEQLDVAEQSIFQLRKFGKSNDAAELRVLLQEAYAALEEHDGQSITGVESGYYDLDEMTSGLQPGEMIILAARPSMGKTALALNIAEHIGANNKQGVAVFSLEMGKRQLAERLMSSRSGIDSQKIRRGMLSPDDFAQLHETCAELSEAPIYIDDTPGLSVIALRAKARRLASRYDIKCILIDYMQLMSCPGSESRQQEVSAISRNIKSLAREMNVPVICLSQLNRASENREGHKPRLSDLRESGSIEQDADVVMMLHREEYYHKEEEWALEHPDEVGKAELIIAKQRNGPTGIVQLQFNGATTRFNNLVKDHSGSDYQSHGSY